MASFEVSADGIPQNMNLEFLDLNATIGLDNPSEVDLSFFSLSLDVFGIKELDAESLDLLRQRMESDNDLAVRFAVSKLGLNPLVKSQLD